MASKYFKQADLDAIGRMQDRIFRPNPPPGVPDSVVDDVAQALLKIIGDAGDPTSGLVVRGDPPTASKAALAADLVEEPNKPVIFTLAGHLENMFTGPAFDTARALELQGVVQVQPIGYDNIRVPFNTSSGITELINQVNVRLFPFPGRKWGVTANSQGGIVWSRAYEDELLPPGGGLTQFASTLRRVVVYGNPCRQKGVVRPGMPMAPGPNTRGIADNRVDNTPSFWWEEVHAGDMFAAIEDDQAGEWATAIYEIVQLNFTRGMNSIVHQVFEVFGNPPREIWAIVAASVRAIIFAANQAPHGGFDIRQAIEHMRGVTS